MFSKFFVVSLLSLFVVASPVIKKRTIESVREDLANVKTEATNFDNAVLALDDTDPTQDQAKAIYQASFDFSQTLDEAASAVRATGSLDDADALLILTDIQGIELVVIKAFEDAVAKKDSFDKVGGAGISGDYKIDLNRTQNLGSALLSNVSELLLSQFAPVLNSISAALTSAYVAVS